MSIITGIEDNHLHAPLLKMAGICKKFGDFDVLSSVDINVFKGEVIALLGENGAGKSTLMKILCGIYKQDGGEIFLDGKKLMIENVSDAMKLGIILIHQEINLLDNLDVAGNIFLGREPLKKFKLIDEAKMYREAQKLLDVLRLKISPKTLVSQLSIAEQQMIGIAKALSQEAKILILDEPTSSLTFEETEILFKVIKDLASKNVTLIYISHRLPEIIKIADRAIVLRDGRNSGELRKDEISYDNMIKLMIGRDMLPPPERETNHSSSYNFDAVNIRTLKYPACENDLRISRGEILGIAGLVGAGRTELINSLFGIGRLAGSISIDGKKMKITRPADAIKNGIYLVPEDRRKQGIIPDMNVTENISLTNLQAYATLGLVSVKKEEKASLNQSKSLNIRSPSLRSALKNLSGGNQQKVAVGKWMAMSPKLIIFDEPTRGVDVSAKGELYRIIGRLAEAGVMILVVSSDMEEIMSISDRIIIMHEGKISGELTRADFNEETIMRLAVG
jgi:ribose transport system ATP-binding protein